MTKPVYYRANCDGEGKARGDLHPKRPCIELGIFTRLRCRRPFQQTAVRDTEPIERSCDRVDHEPCLMREKGKEKHTLQKAHGKIFADATQMIAQRDASALRNNA